jgi:hypothetical protein
VILTSKSVYLFINWFSIIAKNSSLTNIWNQLIKTLSAGVRYCGTRLSHQEGRNRALIFGLIFSMINNFIFSPIFFFFWYLVSVIQLWILVCSSFPSFYLSVNLHICQKTLLPFCALTCLTYDNLQAVLQILARLSKAKNQHYDFGKNLVTYLLD